MFFDNFMFIEVDTFLCFFYFLKPFVFFSKTAYFRPNADRKVDVLMVLQIDFCHIICNLLYSVSDDDRESVSSLMMTLKDKSFVQPEYFMEVRWPSSIIALTRIYLIHLVSCVMLKGPR